LLHLGKESGRVVPFVPIYGHHSRNVQKLISAKALRPPIDSLEQRPDTGRRYFAIEHAPPSAWKLVAVLVSAIAVLYGGFLRNPTVFDDVVFFDGKAPEVYAHSFHPLELRWLPYASLGWTVSLFGYQMVWIRLPNLLLHAATAVALFFFLRRLFELVARGEGAKAWQPKLSFTWFAFFAALLFAMHPVAVYAAGYLIQRTIVMATLFSILVLLLYLEGLERKDYRLLLLAPLLYFFALASKEHSIMLPGVAIWLTLLLRRPSKALLAQVWQPFVLFGLLACWAILKAKGVLGTTYEPDALAMLRKMAEVDPSIDLSTAYPLSVVNQAILFFKYLGLWLVPYPGWMSVDMREAFPKHVLLWPNLLGVAAFVLYPVVAVRLLLQRGRKGLAGFALLFPWTLFATELATVRIQESFVLYRSYLWMGGFLGLLPVVFCQIAARKALWVLTAFALLGAVFSVDRLVSFSHRLLLWKDAEALIAAYPDAPHAMRIHYNLALAYQSLEMHTAALPEFSKFIELEPGRASGYFGRGKAFYQIGRFQDASRDLDRAAYLAPNNGDIRYIYGLTLEALNDHPGARMSFKKACELRQLIACERLRKISTS
jgi:protein O-mannosyl-transferase